MSIKTEDDAIVKYFIINKVYSILSFTKNYKSKPAGGAKAEGHQSIAET